MPEIPIGIMMMVLGIFYLDYSVKKIKKEMDSSDSFDRSILVSDFLASIGLILGGLVLIF